MDMVQTKQLKSLNDLGVDLTLAYAENTKKAYTKALEHYAEYLGGRESSDELLATYVDGLFQMHQNESTPCQIVSALKKVAELNGTEHEVGPLTKQVMRVIRRLAPPPKQAKGLKWEQANRIARHCAMQQGLRGIRDAALFGIMSDAMLRIGEVAELKVRDISDDTVYIARSKTDQKGVGKYLALTKQTVRWCRSWIILAKLEQDDYLINAVFEGKRSARVKKGKMSPRSFTRVIQRRTEAVLGDNAGVTGHSLRVGGAQSLVQHGASLLETQISGRWVSPFMPAHYARKQVASDSAVARLKPKVCSD